MLVKYLLNSSALATSSVATKPINFKLRGMDGVSLIHFKSFWISLSFWLSVSLLFDFQGFLSVVNSFELQCFLSFQEV